MNKDYQARLGGQMERQSSSAAIAARALAFDPDRYRHHVAHLNMSDEARAKLLEVVWRIMNTFVDRAWGEDAAQLAQIAGDSGNAARDPRVLPALCLDRSMHSKKGSLADQFRLSGEGGSKERCGLHD